MKHDKVYFRNKQNWCNRYLLIMVNISMPFLTKEQFGRRRRNEGGNTIKLKWNYPNHIALDTVMMYQKRAQQVHQGDHHAYFCWSVIKYRPG